MFSHRLPITFKNELKIYFQRGELPSLIDQRRLLTTDLKDCNEILKSLLQEGEWIYAGNNHLAVITGEGLRRMFLRRAG